MYQGHQQYDPTEVFRGIIEQCNQGRIIALNGNGERKVPQDLAINMLENVNSNFMYPRPFRDTYAKKTFFPKTKVQEKILYKKPPLTLRNQPKYHQNAGLPANYAGQGIVKNPQRFTRPSYITQTQAQPGHVVSPQVSTVHKASPYMNGTAPSTSQTGLGESGSCY